MQKMRRWDYFQTTFWFLKKALHKVRPIGQRLSFNIGNINIGNFGRLGLGHTI